MGRLVLVCIFLSLVSACSKTGIRNKTSWVPPAECNADAIEDNEIISQSVTSDVLSRTFDFEIIYREKPRFLVTDCNNRQAHSFQFYVAYDTTQLPRSDESWDAIIRGEEIHLGDTIKLRNPKLSGPRDPVESGGWGPLMTKEGIDYQVSDKTVHFSIPWNVLGDSDGRIYYDFLNLNYGGMNLLIRNALVDHP